MSTTDATSPPPAPRAPVAVAATDAAVEAHASRNLFVLAWYHVTLRVAWIFKTESVIMPAFLDTIVGDPALRSTLRGCLPVLNRFGQSVPPLLFAGTLSRLPRKKWALLSTSTSMAVPFLVLSVLWLSLTDKRVAWLPPLFLLLYALFFSATGLNQISFGTLQGKLIRADRRGRLTALAGTVGSVCAITAAWFLMRRWLVSEGVEGVTGFGAVFAFTGVGFVLAGSLMTLVVEPADVPHPSPPPARNVFLGAWELLRDDARFRGVCVVAMLFMTMQLVFPHYQALGREKTAAADAGDQLVLWVVVQNAGAGLFSLLTGPIADRFGNRLVVRGVIFAAALTPVLALLGADGWLPGETLPFALVFFLLGLNPVGMRTFSNYALEFAEPTDYAHYLGTLKLCMAAPFLLSPVVGYLVGRIGFAPVFLAVAAIVAVSGLMTFTLHEPRHDARGDEGTEADEGIGR